MAERHPLDDRVALELLRPVLELAFATARSGARARPPVEPPSGLRAYMNFRRLSGPALAAVRAALDDDEGFRDRVQERAADAEIGEASRLFLRRPDGWFGAVGALVEESRDTESAGEAERRAAELERSVAVAEQAAAQAESERDAEVERAEQAQSSLDAERTRRRAAEAERAAMTERLAELSRHVGVVEKRARAAESSLGDERRRTRELREQVEALSVSAAERAAAPAADPSNRLDGDRSTDGEIGGPTGDPAITVDHEQLATLFDRAAAATAELGRTLRAMGGVLRPAPDPVDRSEPVTRDAPVARRRASRARRRPLVLPGLHEDDIEAAAWLLRQPGANVLIDGYNVTLQGWPAAALPVQRAHLLDLLTTDVSRSGAEIRVVFDGADRDHPEPLPPRCPVRVEFTPADVEADDRILELVAAAPSTRPIVVVSSDNRVRDGARRGGANLISSEQLLAHLRGG